MNRCRSCARASRYFNNTQKKMVRGTRKGKRNLVRACAARYWKSDWNPPVAAPPLSYLYSDAVVPLPKRDIIITHCVRWSVGFFSHERVRVCECVVYYTFRRTTRNGARVSLGIPVSSYVRVMRACVWFCSRPKRRRVVYIIGGLRRPNPACRAPRVRVPSPPKRNTVASFPRLRFICLSVSRTYASFSRPKPCVYSFAAFFFFYIPLNIIVWFPLLFIVLNVLSIYETSAAGRRTCTTMFRDRLPVVFVIVVRTGNSAEVGRPIAVHHARTLARR